MEAGKLAQARSGSGSDAASKGRRASKDRRPWVTVACRACNFLRQQQGDLSISFSRAGSNKAISGGAASKAQQASRTQQASRKQGTIGKAARKHTNKVRCILTQPRVKSPFHVMQIGALFNSSLRPEKNCPDNFS
jgi:hypothetical protein